jgi:hypothetical protein
MRPPFDSLADFTGKGSTRKPPDPPSTKYVEPLGTVQQIEPLAVWEGPSKTKGRIRRTVLFWSQSNLASFHRSFALAGFAVVALIIGTSMLFRVSDVAVELTENTGDVAADQVPENSIPTANEPDPADLWSPDNSVLTFGEDRPAKRTAGRRPARTRFSLAVDRARHLLPRPQFIVSDFIPTTLVIYIENGLVKSRIEPQLASNYSKQPPGSH